MKRKTIAQIAQAMREEEDSARRAQIVEDHVCDTGGVPGDDYAEGARADMPRAFTAEVPVMEPFNATGEKFPDHDDYADHDGLDPIQRMHLDSDRRAADSVRKAAELGVGSSRERASLALSEYRIRHDLSYERMEDHYIAIEQPDGSFQVEVRPTPRLQASAIDGHRPDSNPKSALGIKKVPLHLVSPISILQEAMAMAEGGMKYGPYNYREEKVAATVYIAAALRHLQDWAMGEEHALDSGIHHLAHAKACLGILLDAQACGSMIDDRFKTEAYAKLVREYTLMLPAMATRIKKMADKLEAHQR